MNLHFAFSSLSLSLSVCLKQALKYRRYTNNLSAAAAAFFSSLPFLHKHCSMVLLRVTSRPIKIYCHLSLVKKAYYIFVLLNAAREKKGRKVLHSLANDPTGYQSHCACVDEILQGMHIMTLPLMHVI